MIFLHALWHTLWQRKISLSVYTIGTAAFLWMFVAIYPSFADNADAFAAVIDAYPPELLTAFGIGAGEFSFHTFEHFVATEHYSAVWPLVVIILSIGYAGWALAKEIEAGTIEQVLARPLARWQLYMLRWLAGVVLLAVFSIVSIAVVFPLAAVHGVELIAAHHWLFLLQGWLFGVAVLSLGMMISAMASQKSTVSMIMGGLVLLMYVANVASTLIEGLDWLKYAGFFYYFDAFALLVNGELPLLNVGIFVIVLLVSTAIGMLWFTRRDVAV